MSVGTVTESFLAGAALLFYALPLAALASVTLAVTRRWTLARTVARRATLMAPIAVLLMVLGVVGLVVWGAAVRDDDRVVVLAKGISETMNATALAVLSMLVSGPTWFFARRQEVSRHASATDKAGQ